MNTQSNRAALSLPESLKYTISVVILLVGLGIFAGLYMLREDNAKIESDALIPLVETAALEIYEGDLDLSVTATAVPFREIRVAAEVGGRIAVKHDMCEAGNFVKAGTTLLEIDSTDYELELKTIEAEIFQAEKALAEAQQEITGAANNLAIAKSDYELQQSQFARSKRLRNSLSQKQFDDARGALLGSESQYTGRQNTSEMMFKKKERLQASLELIKSRKAKAELNLARTIVKAPVDGVIVREAVEQGDFVTAARELIVFEDTSRAEVLCNLTPSELDWIRNFAPKEAVDQSSLVTNRVYNLPRVPVQIFDQAEPGVIWQGVLERFDGIGRNETTKSIPCRIVVEQPVVEGRNGPRALVRGMFVKCIIVLPSSRSARQLAAFPSVGVRPGDYVWVVRDDRLKRFDINVIDRSPMRDSISEEKKVVIDFENSGLAIGEKIVVSPLPQPTEDGRVLTLNEDGTTAADRALEVESSDDGNQSGVSKQAANTSPHERSAP